MSSLLSDWCAFSEGDKSYDKSHFLGLLKDHNSKKELEIIFGDFPFADELISRVENVISSGVMEGSVYLLPARTGEPDELVRLGKAWLIEQEKACAVLGDLESRQICRGAKISFVAQKDLDVLLQKDIPQHWLLDEIGDAIRASRIDDSDKVYALFEALYGLSADYYLAWYIGRPLFLFDINLDPYFDFWSAGGRCALTKESFLVSN